jgi:hypothetical protein
VEINHNGPEEVIPWVDVALVMERGGQCSSSAIVPETNLAGRGVEPGVGQGVSMQDDQGDDSAPGSRAAIRSGVPSIETLSAVPPSRDATF